MQTPPGNNDNNAAGFNGNTTNETPKSDSYNIEKKYKDILNNISEGYYETDLSGNITFCNNSLCTILGYPRKRLIGMNYRSFSSSSDHKKVFNAFNTIFTSGEGVDFFEWKIIRNDGTIRFVEASAFPMRTMSQEIYGFRGILKDVTEKKYAEEALSRRNAEYLHLVENARYIIFSTDLNLKVVTVNPIIQEKLGFIEDDIKGSPITDILFQDPKDINNINTGTFIQNIEKVLHNGEHDVTFKSVCKHKYLNEPVVLEFKVDPVIIGNTVTGIIGFAANPSEDPLQEYSREYHAVYEIDNRLTTAEEISHRLTRDLFLYLSYDEINRIRMGVREMIVNAIEHGNLNISFGEKSDRTEFSDYISLVSQRRSLSEYRDNKVIIKYDLNDDYVKYIIRDQGNGFNYQQFLSHSVDTLPAKILHHGRGISLTIESFDIVRYNKKGNEVTLIKYFHKKEPTAR